MNPGEAPARQPAPGVIKYKQLQAAGFSAQELADWRATETGKLQAAGFAPAEVNKYWGALPPTSAHIDNMARNNLNRYGRGEVADNPWEQIQAGFGTTGAGLLASGKTPDYVLPKDAGLWAKVLYGVGQLGGDLPTSAVGGIAGFFAGGGAGAAASAPTAGVAAPVTTPVGALVGAGFGAGAAPVALREAVMGAYTAGEINTKEEAFERITTGVMRTLKGGVVGAITAPLGGLVGGRVMSAGGGAVLGTTANVTTQALGGTALGGALEGQVPDFDDFTAAAIVALGTHGAVTAGSRMPSFFPKPGDAASRVAQSNLEGIYRQTGTTPKAAAAAARTNPVFRQETMQQDVNGQPVIPVFRREAAADVEPFKPSTEAVDEPGSIQLPALNAQPTKTLGTIREASAMLVKLEGSSDTDVSSAGAIGKHQIMPNTAKQYGFEPSRLFEPAYNKRVHDAIVADLHKRYGGDMEAIATAYNAGPGRANKLVTQGPGTRLEAYPDKKLKSGIRYERVQTGRNEAFLPLETQRYLANLRRRNGGGGKAPPPGDEGGRAAGDPQLPAKRGTTELDESIKTVKGEREDWGAKSAEERYAAARDMIQDPDDGNFFAILDPDLALDQIVSELRPARVLDNAIFREHPEMDRDRTYGIEDAFRNTYGSEDRASLFIRDGAIDGYTNTFIQGSANAKQAFDLARKNGGNQKNLEEFQIALRTVEKQDQGINTGMDPELAKAIISDKVEAKKYAEPIHIFQKVGDSVLDYAVAKGLYSREQADLFISKNLAWVSLARVQGDEAAFAPSTIRNFKVGTAIHRMEGSDKKIISPTIASIDNWRRIIVNADRNEAAGIVVGLARDGLVPAGYKFERVGLLGDGELSASKALAPYVPPAQVNEATQAFMADVAQEIFKRTGRPDEFLYFNDGKAEIWRASSPELARLLRGAENASEANIIVAGMQAVASLKRAGITSMPDFALKTTLSDQIGAWITDPFHPPPFFTLALGVFKSFDKDFVRDWKAAGGAGASMVAMDKNYLERDVGVLFDDTGFTDKAWNTVKSPLILAQFIQERVDAAQRLGHKAFVESKGVEPRKAAMLGRKTYVDFKERATLQLVNTWAKVAPFLRPTMLGMKNIGEAAAARPVDTALHLGILATVVTGLGILSHMEDPDLPENRKFKNLAQWKKDQYITTPEVFGIRFKLATRDATTLVNMTVNRALDHFIAHDKHAFDKFASSYMKSLLPGLSPAIATPISEATFNYSEFSGRPLMPASLEDASAPMQYVENTTETAKKLSKWLSISPLGAQVSPIVIDNYIRGYLGPVGTGVANVLDAKDEDEVRPKELADNPFVAGFVHRSEGAGADPIQNFYDAYDKVREAKRDVSLAKSRQDIDEMRAARQNPLAGVDAQQVAKALSKMTAHIKAVTRDEDMSVDEKRQFIEAQYSRMIVVARRGLEVIDRRKEKAEERERARSATTLAPAAPKAPPAPPPPGENRGLVPIA